MKMNSMNNGTNPSTRRVCPATPGGPEGTRELDSDIVVDETALRDIEADLDDPDRITLLDGAMDDPDGTPPATDIGKLA
jgi:hypothetical protein